MTKEPKGPHSFLQKWSPATPRELVMELERLATHYPRTDMDARKWALMFESFLEDFKGKSLEEIRYGCRRYRQKADNRFFPTPGQLLEACKNPFDTKERKYAELDDLPPAMPEQDARALIERIGRKYNVRDPNKVDLVAVKEEILARPPVPFVPMTPERRNELLAHMKQNLRFKFGDQEAQKYIAELPE